jgi:lysozyme family protein
MADFNQGFAFLMGDEGSTLLDDPKTGEYSRFGITLRTAAGLGICHPDDKEFIDALTEISAKAIYQEHFWAPLHLDCVREQQPASKLFDMAVNMGPYRAVKLTQQACNAVTAPALSIATDGQMGHQTYLCMNVCKGDQLLLEMRAQSLQFYRDLVDSQPDKYAKYWNAWKARAEK